MTAIMTAAMARMKLVAVVIKFTLNIWTYRPKQIVQARSDSAYQLRNKNKK